jgi:hypothetical protein
MLRPSTGDEQHVETTLVLSRLDDVIATIGGIVAGTIQDQLGIFRQEIHQLLRQSLCSGSEAGLPSRADRSIEQGMQFPAPGEAGNIEKGFRDIKHEVCSLQNQLREVDERHACYLKHITEAMSGQFVTPEVSLKVSNAEWCADQDMQRGCRDTLPRSLTLEKLVQDVVVPIEEISTTATPDTSIPLEQDGTQRSEATPIENAIISVREDSSLASVFLNDHDVARETYHVEDYYKKTGCAQALTQSSVFNHLTVLVVCANAVWIGVEADWNHATNMFDADPVFQFGGLFFVLYFAFEWLVRLHAFRRKTDAFTDGWFKFDTFLVVSMMVDVLLMAILKFKSHDGGNTVAIPTQPLRVLRLLKLSRMARLMRAFPELVTMLKGLTRSLRAIFSSCLLIILIVYIWAIMMHLLLKDEKALNEQFYKEQLLHFSTVTDAMWALVMDGTFLLDGAGQMMTLMVFNDALNIRLAGFLFLIFVMLSSVLVMQMLIGILTDVVNRVNDEQRNAASIALIKQELLAKLSKADDGDGSISRDEMFNMIRQSRAIMNKLDINQAFLFQLVDMMFATAKSKISIKQALELILLCRSENSATVETLAGGFSFMEKEINILQKQVAKNIALTLKQVETQKATLCQTGGYEACLVTTHGREVALPIDCNEASPVSIEWEAEADPLVICGVSTNPDVAQLSL